jgi:hypothetical protein
MIKKEEGIIKEK